MEKFLSRSFPSFCGRTVFSSFPPLFFSTQTVGAPASADRAQAPRRPPSPQPQLLPPPELHRATISGTALLGTRASSPWRRRQGRAPRPRLGAGRGELPWARGRGSAAAVASSLGGAAGAPSPGCAAGARRRGRAPWAAQPELPPLTARVCSTGRRGRSSAAAGRAHSAARPELPLLTARPELRSLTDDTHKHF